MKVPSEASGKAPASQKEGRCGKGAWRFDLSPPPCLERGYYSWGNGIHQATKEYKWAHQEWRSKSADGAWILGATLLNGSIVPATGGPQASICFIHRWLHFLLLAAESISNIYIILFHLLWYLLKFSIQNWSQHTFPSPSSPIILDSNWDPYGSGSTPGS